jgi:ABC-type dipeptide/oligopeptide/nickel transport system permease subunit
MRAEGHRPGWGAWAGAAILALAVAAAALAPLLAPFDSRAVSGAPLLGPSALHPLGTNDVGQDLFSQWLWGARASLVVAILVALCSTVLSWGIGIAAGVWRPASGALMGLADLLLALPSLPLYLLVATMVGSSQGHVVIMLTLLSWPAFARIVLSQVVVLRGAPYVEAAWALGASPLRVARAHLLPGTLMLLPAKLVFTFRFAIFAEATLAILGLGDPAGTSWGTTLGWDFNDALLFSRGTWAWWVLPPAASIVLLVLATTWLATGLEAAQDPRRAHVENPARGVEGHPSPASRRPALRPVTAEPAGQRPAALG